MNFAEFAPYLALVFVVAALYGSVGHGGASGYIAVLSLSTLGAAQVSSTALVLNLVVSGIAWVNFARSQLFDWRLTWPFVLGSIPAAFAGAMFKVEDRVYFLILGAVLLYAAVQLFLRVTEKLAAAVPNTGTEILIGVAIGLVSGLVGVGGGIFLSPLVVLMGWADAKRAAATSALFIFVNSVAGVGGRLATGSFRAEMLFPLLVAALIGGLLGSSLGSRLFDAALVRRLLSLVLLVAALRHLHDFLVGF